MSANAFLPSPQPAGDAAPAGRALKRPRLPRDFAQFSETVRPLGLYWLGLNEAPRERP